MVVYKLKLIRGRSYTGCGIYATAERPFVNLEAELKDTVDYLVGCGRFAIVGSEDIPSRPSPVGDQQPAAADEPNIQWTRSQLTAYATENGIDLMGTTSKADMLAKITDAENAIDYGEHD